MEKSKRKIITLASLFLCCLAIVGVGFAAWVITGEDTEETKGSITVDTVSDERFVIEVLDSYIKETKEAVDTTVVLGGPETTPADAWITYNGEKEDLDAVIVVKVKNYDKQNCEVTAAITDKTKYEYLVTAGYLADATPVVTLIGTESDTEGVNYGIYSITITFDWGSDFGGENPVTYFNGLGGSGDEVSSGVTVSDQAFEALSVITAAANLEFTLTVYAKVGE